MNKLHVVALGACALVSAAQAQNSTMNDSGFYGEVGFSHMSVTGPTDSTKPHGTRLLVGRQMNPHLGLELMYNFNTTKEARVGYDASFNGVGVLIKPQTALSDQVDVFARVGVMSVSINAAAAGTHTGTDIAWGLGIQTKFNKSAYGQLDNMNFYDRERYSAKGYSLSVGVLF